MVQVHADTSSLVVDMDVTCLVRHICESGARLTYIVMKATAVVTPHVQWCSNQASAAALGAQARLVHDSQRNHGFFAAARNF